MSTRCRIDSKPNSSMPSGPAATSTAAAIRTFQPTTSRTAVIRLDQAEQPRPTTSCSSSIDGAR